MKQSKLFIISLVLNALVFLLVITGIIIMLTVGSGPLADRSIFVFKYFTFQSNIFVGVVSFVYAYYQLLIILGKKSKLPHVLLVFNHVGVSAVSLTFLIVVAFLAPGYGYGKMYIGANLFFHALVPLVAIINYLFFEKEAKISFKNTLFCLLPCALYGTVYFIVVASQNAYGNLSIDFYGFGKGGPWIGALNFVIVLSISYAIGLFLYFINQLVFKKRR